MWPWEHVAVGYLAYSIMTRAWTRRPPRDAAAVAAVGFGALFPDLVDKPLAWTFGVLPSGTSLGHSVVLALPLTAALALLTWHLGRPTVGVAFAIGYFLHLPSDALYGALVLGAPVTPGSFAWPLAPAAPIERPGFGSNFWHYFERYLAFLTGPDGVRYLVAELLLMGGALGLWLRDGAPGLGVLVGSARHEPDLHG